MAEMADLLKTVCEIRDLVRLLAEPALAERDRKHRENLKQIVGKSSLKGKAVLLMDGTRTQKGIQKESAINQGDLSVLVKKLRETGLLSDDGKQPRLVISIPANFFGSTYQNE